MLHSGQRVSTKASAAALLATLFMPSCSSPPPPPPAPVVTRSPALVATMSQTINALRETQQTIARLLICESLQPGLLGRLRTYQSGGIQFFTREAILKLESAVNAGKALSKPIPGHSEQLEALISQIIDLNRSLVVQPVDAPASKDFSKAFEKGMRLYSRLTEVISVLKLETEIVNPPLAQILLQPDKSSPDAGASRLNAILGIPQQTIQRDIEEAKEHAAEKVRLAAQEAARIEAEKASRPKSYVEEVASIAQLAKRELIAASRAHQEAFANVTEVRTNGEAAYVRLDDNNLLKLEQIDGVLKISKNASGYAEYGADGKIAGFGGAVDWSTTNVYGEISYLEALAYVGYDLEKLVGAVNNQASQFRNIIDPNFVRLILAPLVCDRGKLGADVLNDPLPLVVTWGPEYVKQLPSPSYPVYLRLNDSTMLRMVQFGSTVKFERNASGYGVAGFKVDLYVVSGGGEIPSLNKYVEISPVEAIAYFDGDWRPMLKAVSRQSIALGDRSVWPDTLLNTICPNQPQTKVRWIQFKNEWVPGVSFADVAAIKKANEELAKKQEKEWNPFKFSMPEFDR